MKLATVGNRTSSPLFEMFSRIIEAGQNLPMPVEHHRPLASRIGQQPELSLADGRSIQVDGRKVDLPLGVDAQATGSAVKAFAGVYRGRVLFLQQANGWRQINDNEVVGVGDKERFRTEEQPVFRTAPRLTVD